MALRLITLLLPATLLLAGAFAALLPVASLPQPHQDTVAALPYLLALIAGFLGCSFKRSRILFAAINLVGAYFLIQNFLQTSLGRPDAYVLFTAISLLLPLNIALIALCGERGVFTLAGLLRIMVTTSGYAALYLLLQSGQLPYLLPHLPASMLEMVAADTYLSEAAAVTFLLSLLPVLGSLLLRKTHADAGLLASLIAALVMTLWFDRPMISSLFVSAALIALAISVVQNSYNMAFIDELTGIPARRALRDKLATLGRKYSIAMMDIDHFKKFNDTYGHDIGDQVLRMVAAKINQVKGGGKAYRYGGEEFTVVFAGKDEQQALAYLEEVRETIANYPMAIRSEQRPEDNKEGKRLRDNHPGTEVVSVTISIGLAEKQDSHDDADAVIKSADQALYRAKEAGRNCTISSLQPEEPQPTRKRRRNAGAPKDFARQS